MTGTAGPSGNHAGRRFRAPAAREGSAADSRQEARKTDAFNRLPWQFPPQRMEAAAVRDSALAVAGLLNLAVGGSSVFPSLPPGMPGPAGGWELNEEQTDQLSSCGATTAIRCSMRSAFPTRMSPAPGVIKRRRRPRLWHCSTAAWPRSGHGHGPLGRKPTGFHLSGWAGSRQRRISRERQPLPHGRGSDWAGGPWALPYERIAATPLRSRFGFGVLEGVDFERAFEEFLLLLILFSVPGFSFVRRLAS